jgi:rubrerythrin
MAETADQIRNALEKIRDDAQKALKLLGGSADQRSLAWKCAGCGHIKHFTRPVPADVAKPCPKCRGELFMPS